MDQEQRLIDSIEIVNLEAIKQLPKATEHFISDLHGEFEAFDHIMRNCSGVIRSKINELFKDELSQAEQDNLCFMIYYPEDLIEGQIMSDEAWHTLLNQLVRLARYVTTKYTRSKVRKSMPKNYAYILEELMYQYDEEGNKEDYYRQIFETIIELDLDQKFAIVLAHLIQRSVVDHLHVLGDIYDRGPNPHKIIDRLMEAPSLDIQLGNHDIIWIGAYCGSLACLANVIRIQLRYGHTPLLEEGYDIDLSRLGRYAELYYDDNPAFQPKVNLEEISEKERLNVTRMHQAISIIQFKLEGQIIARRPEFKLNHRQLLEKLSADRESITIDGEVYPIVNGCFKLVDPENPYELTLGEELIILDLLHQFQKSETMKKHIEFLVEEGTLYKVYNGNLLYHGCIPATKSGKLMDVTFQQGTFAGKELMDFYQSCIDEAYRDISITDDYATDVVWYLWCGEGSNLFGKKMMKTFERYFTEDKALHKEPSNAYYQLRETQEFCDLILDDFGLDDCGYIVNGHTPIKTLEGEDPVKADGRMLVIDGGMAKPYQKVTGIAGYTLIDNSFQIYLVAHHPFTTKEQAIKNFQDIIPTKRIVRTRDVRLKVNDTDIGYELRLQEEELRRRCELEA